MYSEVSTDYEQNNTIQYTMPTEAELFLTKLKRVGIFPCIVKLHNYCFVVCFSFCE